MNNKTITKYTEQNSIYEITFYHGIQVMWIECKLGMFRFIISFTKANEPIFTYDNLDNIGRVNYIPNSVLKYCEKYLSYSAFI